MFKFLYQRRPAGFPGALALVLTLWLAAVSVAATPELPEDLRQAGAKGSLPTLLEFYADWCTTCRKMLPVVRRIQDRTDGKLRVVRLDIDAPENRRFVEQFQINGTPTYLLFNESGKPVFTLRDYISSTLLETMVDRTAGLSRPVPFPKGIPELEREILAPLVLFQFHRPGCKPCPEAGAFNRAMAAQLGGRVAVIELDPGEPTVRKFMKKISLRRTPGYALMDREGYGILRLESVLGIGEKRYLWQFIRLVLSGLP